MKVRKHKLKPRGRLLGERGIFPPSKWPKTSRGFVIIDAGEHGHDEHNTWDWYLIIRFK